jgi:hypothetical protein
MAASLQLGQLSLPILKQFSEYCNNYKIFKVYGSRRLDIILVDLNMRLFNPTAPTEREREGRLAYILPIHIRTPQAVTVYVDCGV